MKFFLFVITNIISLLLSVIVFLHSFQIYPFNRNLFGAQEFLPKDFTLLPTNKSVSVSGLASSNGLRISAGATTIAGSFTVSGASNFTANVGFGSSTAAQPLSVQGLTLYGTAGATSTNIGNQDIYQNLRVQGSLQAVGGCTGCPTVNIGGTNGAVQFNSSNSFNGDANNFFWNNTNKSLGLVTSNPLTTLDVRGTGTILGTMNLLNGTINFGTGSATSTLSSISGNFGISTTSPFSILSVGGNISLGSGATTTISEESTIVRSGCLQLRSSTGAWISLYAGAGGATSTGYTAIGSGNQFSNGGASPGGLLVISSGPCSP